MDVQAALEWCDQIITEVDIDLMEWNQALDRVSLAGIYVPIELWTNDDPPRQVTSSVLSQAAGKELRVMHHVNGEWTKIGTAKVDGDGRITAEITANVPELKPYYGSVSIREPLAHFEIGPDGKWKQNYPLAGFDPMSLCKPLTIRGLEEAIAKEEDRLQRRNRWLDAISSEKPLTKFVRTQSSADTEPDIENHPFFNQKED